MSHVFIFMWRTLVTIFTSPTIINYFKWVATNFTLTSHFITLIFIRRRFVYYSLTRSPNNEGVFWRGQTPKLPLRWCEWLDLNQWSLDYQSSAFTNYATLAYARQFIFTRNFPLKPRLTYFPRRPVRHVGFLALMRINQREHRALTFSSPPLGFHSVRIRCTTCEMIHLVMRRVLWHITYSYLAYQPNQEFLFYLGRVSQTPRTNSLFIGA